MRKTGHYETIDKKKFFLPDPLPPKHPPLELDSSMLELYGDTMLHLGKINEIINTLPNIELFLNIYVMKEALLSSAIEGVNTTMLDVFTQPLIESKPDKNTQLVMNYTKALYKAVDMIKEEGFPISSRVILQAHETLMQLGEGDKANPGHYRRCSVKVGNLIPAPWNKVPELMSSLEKFINTHDSLSSLIKAGLAHVQFETIHPFLDGNGRIGRMLIILILIDKNLLQAPILYPSYYFQKHRLEYNQKLDRVRTHGDFEGWISFYLTAIKDSCIDAYKRAKDIEALQEQLTQKITGNAKLTKSLQTKLKGLSFLFSSPVVSITKLSEHLDSSYNTAGKIIAEFVQLEILTQEKEQKRGKLFVFRQYLNIFKNDYE